MQSSNAILNLSEEQYSSILEGCDPWLWAQQNQIKLVSNVFTDVGHEFQRRPMTVKPPVKVIRKATQLTFTETEVLNTLHGMIFGFYPVGVYYLFPTKDKVSEFSKSRFKPLIDDNPETIGCHIRDTDSANLKRIGSGFLFFSSGRLGQDIQKEMKTSVSLVGTPADHAVHDEYDLMDPRIDEHVEGRLAKSKRHTKTYLSNPTIPDYMIDKKFKSSSQEYWHIKCDHCGRYICLDDEDNFPRLFHEKPDGLVIRACSNPRCGRALNPRHGMWVAKRPDTTDILGFTIGHPSAYWVDPKRLLDDYRNPEIDKANFTRLRLGRPYIEAENRLSVEETLACCSDYGIESSDKGPCFMGVDQGGSDYDLLHVVIGKKTDGKKGKVVHLEIYKGWSELDRLMRVFTVSRCVVDGLPNTDEARSFAKRFPGKVYLSFFSEHQKGHYKWDEEQQTVISNRTEGLDHSHKEIAEKKILLPARNNMTVKFAEHCHNIAKKLEEDVETGSKRYVYIKLDKKDHFRFAFNYESMARNETPEPRYKVGV